MQEVRSSNLLSSTRKTRSGHKCRPTQKAPKIARPSLDRRSGHRWLEMDRADWLWMTARNGACVMCVEQAGARAGARHRAWAISGRPTGCTPLSPRRPSPPGPACVVVARAGVDETATRLPYEGVLAVVEVFSPSTVSIDRAVKPGMYAEAGIPVYWRVELHGMPK